MMSTAPRWIAHLDLDAAFCQAAYRAWPEKLAGVEHLIVGGHPERRGVVTSTTYPCRTLGIHAGMPMKTAIQLAPHAVAAPVPWATVRRLSKEFFSVVRRFGERTERSSIDEGYLLLPADVEDPEAYAQRVRQAVLAEVGVTCSLGVSRIRFIAKMATTHAKPGHGGSGVHVVPASKEYDFVGRAKLGEIPYVGPALLEDLARRGVTTVASIRGLDLATLTLWLGRARAAFLYDRVRAIDPSGVSAEDEPRKSISSEQTFERDHRDLPVLERELEGLVADVGRTLRREHLFARAVAVKVRGSDFKDVQRHRTLAQFVITDEGILRVAKELLHELRSGQSSWVRLLGITLSGLEGPGAAEQMTLDPVVPPLESDDERARARAAS